MLNELICNRRVDVRGKCSGVDGSEHRLPDTTESEAKEGGGAAGQQADLLKVRTQ